MPPIITSLKVKRAISPSKILLEPITPTPILKSLLSMNFLVIIKLFVPFSAMCWRLIQNTPSSGLYESKIIQNCTLLFLNIAQALNKENKSIMLELVNASLTAVVLASPKSAVLGWNTTNSY